MKILSQPRIKLWSTRWNNVQCGCSLLRRHKPLSTGWKFYVYRPRPTWSVAGQSSQGSQFDSRPHVEFAVDKVLLRQVLLSTSGFPCQYHLTVAPCSSIHHRRHITSAINSAVKKQPTLKTSRKFSETLVITYQITRCHKPKYNTYNSTSSQAALPPLLNIHRPTQIHSPPTSWPISHTG